MSPPRLEPRLRVSDPASRRRPSQGDVEVRLLLIAGALPRAIETALYPAPFYPGATTTGEEVLFHDVYAIIPEETEIGGFWSFWLRSRPALKDRPRQDCAARLVTRLVVGLVDVKTKKHEYAGSSIGEQLVTRVYLQIYDQKTGVTARVPETVASSW